MTNDSREPDDHEPFLRELLYRLGELDTKLDQIIAQTSVSKGAELDRRLSRVEGRIAKYYYDLARLIRVSREQLPSEIVEYSVLRRDFSPQDTEMPQLGGWRLNPTTIVSLVRYLGEEIGTKNGGGVVLDLGSGSSTYWFATAIKSVGIDAHVYAVDHLSEYLTQTMSTLERAGLQDFVTPILAPLAPYRFAQEGRSWYDVSELQHLEGIDLMLVDGPPSADAEDARWPALSFFGSRMNANSLICLDDTFRPGEKRIVEAWLTEYPNLEILKDDGAATLLKWK